MMANDNSPTLASIVLADGGDDEFWWQGAPGAREAIVFKTDRYGQRWILEIESTHWVTQRIAAGLLEVTFMTISNWIAEGKIRQTKKRNGVTVIPLREIERIAEARGMFIRKPLTPDQSRRLRKVSFKRKRGGDETANQG